MFRCAPLYSTSHHETTKMRKNWSWHVATGLISQGTQRWRDLEWWSSKRPKNGNKKGPTCRSTLSPARNYLFRNYPSELLFVLPVLAAIPALVHSIHEPAAGACLARRTLSRTTEFAR